ncbi:MAG: hypothetical protein IKQ60_09540 [Candidatus Methanomethylophilaceae archaeon]|jgi:hypothetical protein|nr:hypothetical protein [Candidatus Methanomethylophilaceae archaeon]
MADDKDPNAGLFGDDEPELSPEEAHEKMTFGRNPDRVRAMSDLFGNDLIASALEDPSLPEEAKRQMIFKLTANSVLDMVMDSLSPETAEEVAQCIDGYIGVGIVNKKFGIDLYKELYEALSKVERNEGESEEDYDRRLDEMSDQWWYIPQPLLNKRNPSDAIREEMARYGLEDR